MHANNANQNPDDEEKIVIPQSYDYEDLLKFQNPNMYSSIGKTVLSTKPSAAAYGFGTADRKKQAKVFQSKELCKTQFVGTTSPGPNYEVRHTDNFYFQQDPQWSFGKEIRNTLNTGAKHAHYNRKDVDFDPINADNTRRWNQGNVKIGLESRFANAPSKVKGTPGPEYNPPEKPEYPIAPKYSIGIRREPAKGGSVLQLPISTPNQVGPGSYLRLDQQNTSIMPDHPKFSFTKEAKHKHTLPSFQKNQTFDTRSSLGSQASSKNRTMSVISVGKAKRDAPTGTFSNHMTTQTTRIRIPHPRF